MSTIALFHSSFGVRPGVTDAADRLRAAGHDVTVVDQYDGRTFDDYDVADAFVAELGYPELMARAVSAVADLPDGFIAMGFSNGAGMATHVAQHGAVAAVVLCSGATPLEWIGAHTWPTGVPVQIHQAIDDHRGVAGAAAAVSRSVTDAGADAEIVEYPGTGHLFTDASLPGEYDPAAGERLWPRVLRFCAEQGV